MRRLLHPLRRCALLTLGFSPCAFAGSVMQLDMKEYYEDPPVISTIEISTQGRSSRMEVTGGGDDAGGMIWRGESADMVAIDHDSREYYVLDRASMERMAERLGDAMQAMQKELERMPPEQRAMAEQMMKKHLPRQAAPAEPATLHATGRTDAIGGYDCAYYEVRRAEVKLRELCVTPWDELPDGRSMSVAMLEMAGFLESMASTFAEGTGMDVMGGQQEIFQYMRELDGYPVLTRELDESGKVTSETVLRSADERDLEPAVFQPPAGYARRDPEF
ncbi:MAG TPA: hypothetical protein VF200_15230 [Woeseiaceae bacterium]